MRKLTGWWSIICLTIILTEDTACDLNVSSKIDLDSNEIQLTSTDRPVIVSNQRERIVDVQREPSIRINEQSNPWLRRTGQSFVRSSFSEDLRKRRTHLSSVSITFVESIKYLFMSTSFSNIYIYIYLFLEVLSILINIDFGDD